MGVGNNKEEAFDDAIRHTHHSYATMKKRAKVRGQLQVTYHKREIK
jgi:hypothetical protein